MKARFDDPDWRKMLSKELAEESTCNGLVPVIETTGICFETLNAVAHGDYRGCTESNFWGLARWLSRRCEKWLRDCQIDGWLFDLKTGEIRTADGRTWPNIYAFVNYHGFGSRNDV